MTRLNEDLGSAHILLVDDDQRVVRSMKRFLELYGGRVSSLSRMGEVMPWLAENTPDIIVLDFHLPDGDGLSLCSEIRGLPSPPPVVVITGDDDVKRRAEALSEGADDLLLKPLHPHILLRRLSNVLYRYRVEAQNRRLIRRLESYVSTAAAVHLLGPETSERIDATLVFSDLRGFTAASFTQDAAAVFEQVNQVLTTQSRIIRQCGGYVDGFSGDGLLALFEGDQAAEAACTAAASILRWAEKTSIGTWERLPVGMGLHRGEVIRGDLGDSDRRVYTVLGSPVNIAARLCGAAEALEAVVSHQLVARLEDNAFDKPRDVMLRGLPAPLRIYSLRSEFWLGV